MKIKETTTSKESVKSKRKSRDRSQRCRWFPPSKSKSAAHSSRMTLTSTTRSLGSTQTITTQTCPHRRRLTSGRSCRTSCVISSEKSSKWSVRKIRSSTRNTRNTSKYCCLNSSWTSSSQVRRWTTSRSTSSSQRSTSTSRQSLDRRNESSESNLEKHR